MAKKFFLDCEILRLPKWRCCWQTGALLDTGVEGTTLFRNVGKVAWCSIPQDLNLQQNGRHTSNLVRLDLYLKRQGIIHAH